MIYNNYFDEVNEIKLNFESTSYPEIVSEPIGRETFDLWKFCRRIQCVEHIFVGPSRMRQ